MHRPKLDQLYKDTSTTEKNSVGFKLVKLVTIDNLLTSYVLVFASMRLRKLAEILYEVMILLESKH
jgi:hypothetical protein